MDEKAEAVQERSMRRNTNFRVLPRGDPSSGAQASEYDAQAPSMLPMHQKKMSVPAVQGLWEADRKGCRWYPAKCCVFLRDMCMEEKAEAVQEQGLQRNTYLSVLPREDPSNGDETSEYKQQKSSMLPVH